MKIIENTLFVLLVLSGLFIIGPQTEAPDLVLPQPEISLPLSELKDWINTQESTFDNIKKDNASQLEFYDSIPQKTAYSVLYLHGFSASTEEGDPVHRNIALALKANLYLPRLSDHGLIEEEPMLNFTGQKYLDSAKRPWQSPKKLVKKSLLFPAPPEGRCP